MIAERSFESRAQSASQARNYVRGLLGEVDETVADAITLMVSELATNCVVHAVTDFTVTVEQTPDRIHVAVTDRAPGHPRLRTPPPTSPNGRGLQIVRTFADDWGVQRADDAIGKTVWFTVALRSPRKSASLG